MLRLLIYKNKKQEIGSKERLSSSDGQMIDYNR